MSAPGNGAPTDAGAQDGQEACRAAPGLTVQILHVPDCANLERVRTRVERALARLGLTALVEELEGPYPSPTLLIDGVEVIPPSGNTEASCRLDLPSEGQILDALARSDPRRPPARHATDGG